MLHLTAVSQVFLQIAVILLACRGSTAVFKRIGQPPVMAEMITGVLLGPSFLGLIAPGLQAKIFPDSAHSTLVVLSQIGLMLYMFVVGLEFDFSLVRGRVALAISTAGIVVPMVMGGALGVYLMGNPGLYSDGVSAPNAALFMAAAMSITAFPVLARIIREKNASGTALGTLALSAGAFDDAVAWCLLAIVIASMKGSEAAAWITLLGTAGYLAFLFLGGKPMLRWFSRRFEENPESRSGILATLLILLLLASFYTDLIGIHCVFGAFMLGAAVPKGMMEREMRGMVEPLTVRLLVPLFFVVSGTRTQIGTLDSASYWGVAAVILFVAIFSKAFGCWGAARLCGVGPRDSLGVGVLMNTRGMMELILLNIGLEIGVIQPPLFTMLVMMAIVTTFMTGPLFDRVREARVDQK